MMKGAGAHLGLSFPVSAHGEQLFSFCGHLSFFVCVCFHLPSFVGCHLSS